jgi:tryptophanyl-tRNA synthetase
MSRMVEFKDKSARIGDDRVTVGLFNYPILMAADILLYNASYVPVGDDQRQHLEFARDIAEHLNKKFNDLFVMPEPVAKQHEFFGKDQGLRIKDLTDPTKKMSKSEEPVKGIIYLGDEPAVAAQKIMGSATDSLASIHLDWDQQPGVTNLLQILALLRNQTLDEVGNEWAGKTSYGELKNVVAEAVKHFLEEFQTKTGQVDEARLMAKLETGEAKMNEIANAMLTKVQKAVGLRP